MIEASQLGALGSSYDIWEGPIVITTFMSCIFNEHEMQMPNLRSV